MMNRKEKKKILLIFHPFSIFFTTKHHGKSLQKQHNFLMKSQKLQDVSALQNVTEIWVFILTVKQNGNPPNFF